MNDAALMGKKVGEMAPEELNRLLADVPSFSDEDKEEYDIPDIRLNEYGYCDDPEIIAKSLKCLADKLLAYEVIQKVSRR
ncbi:MAG: hypothetical protein N2690_00410 [Rhodocyclaceae bacterium]|nr:hypothetical protein [Rhodocyclaceae bacterium]